MWFEAISGEMGEEEPKMGAKSVKHAQKKEA